MTTINPELLRVREVAGLLGIGVSTVWLKVRQGILPKPVKLGCSVRWRRVDLDQWLSALTADRG